MRPRRRLVTALVALTALAGCGGSAHLSAAAYRTAAGSACESEIAYVRSVPTLQRSEHLTVAEIEQRVRRRGARYVATMRALHPPPQLQAAHERLLKDQTGAPPGRPTRATLITFERRIADDYAALGLAPCAAASRRSVAQLETSP
jgi:hypothetical protein